MCPFLSAILAEDKEQPRLVYRDYLQEDPSRGWSWEHLHRLVLHHPGSDQLRLLCADWLDERGVLGCWGIAGGCTASQHTNARQNSLQNMLRHRHGHSARVATA